MSLAEEFLKYCIHYCLENNKDDLNFLDQRMDDEEKGLKKMRDLQWPC